jgi:hypothetical protein
VNDALASVFFPQDMDVEARIRQAVVSSTSPVEVTLGGQSGIPAATCHRYTASVSVNDVVLVVQLGPDLIIIDTIDTGG